MSIITVMITVDPEISLQRLLYQAIKDMSADTGEEAAIVEEPVTAQGAA